MKKTNDNKLPFTLCFCRVESGKILMLHRHKSPNSNKWNGLGGKIENEDPRDSVIREIKEEANIDLNKALKLHYAGTVTWVVYEKNKLLYSSGMYTFIADFDDSIVFDKIDTREGMLEWKEIGWICDKANRDVVDNIPHFLPPMLDLKEPAEYRCTYKDGLLEKVEVINL